MASSSRALPEKLAHDGQPGHRQAHANPSASPWVIVAGGFHRNGGMDKANLALAQYLVEHEGTRVHLVCHTVDEDFAKNPAVTVHRVARPGGSFFLGRPMLDWSGRRIAGRVTRQWPGARVVVNGDNCLWPGINWVHYLHHAWTPPKEGPLWFRTKQTLGTSIERSREKSTARMSRVFITNSNRTRRDVIDRLRVQPERVHTVYLGAESEWGLVSDEERAASRKRFGISETRPAALFLGSLGFDNRKGFDVLFKAWANLCTNESWDVELVVAGAGNALSMWRSEISRQGLQHRIRILGFIERVHDLLAAADVLVSPARYEPYGLNVQEAICRGVPAIVSASAGVSERYGPELQPLLLPDPEDADDLVRRLWIWRSKMKFWQDSFRQLGSDLRAYGWRDMARQIVSIAASCHEKENSAAYPDNLPESPDRARR